MKEEQYETLFHRDIAILKRAKDTLGSYDFDTADTAREAVSVFIADLEQELPNLIGNPPTQGPAVEIEQAALRWVQPGYTVGAYGELDRDCGPLSKGTRVVLTEKRGEGQWTIKEEEHNTPEELSDMVVDAMQGLAEDGLFEVEEPQS